MPCFVQFTSAARRTSGGTSGGCRRVFQRQRLSLAAEPLEERRLLTITVNTLVDEADGSIVDGDVSLRDAIGLAPVGETIDFSVTGTILLTLGELLIEEDLTITGPGADMLTIDASGNDPTPDSTFDDGNPTNDGDGSRVFNVDDFSANNLDVTITDLRLTGGDIEGFAGGLFSREQLTLERIVAEHNFATESGGAAVVWSVSGGSTHVTDSVFNENYALLDGGGLIANAADDSLMSVSGCRITDNVSYGGAGGAGISGLHDSTVTVADCVITGNATHGGVGGGGLDVRSLGYGSVDVERVVVADNTSDVSAGGVFAWGTLGGVLRIANSVVSNNTAASYGGGILAYTTADTALLTLENLTISGNSTSHVGGGIAAAAIGGGETIAIEQNTISGNEADGNGGGVWTLKAETSVVAVRHSTITGNTADADFLDLGTGGGLFATSASGTTVDHSIIAGNHLGSGGDNDVVGFLNATSAFNVIGVDVGLTGVSDGVDGNQIGSVAVPIVALLGPLADNGGTMLPDGTVLMTHALQAGSPAIDTGDPAAMAGIGIVPEFDQRGDPFGRVAGAWIDIGAYELDATSGLPGDGNLDGYVDGLDYIIWALNFGDDPADDPPGSPLNGDYNDDGRVDGLDYVLWASNFGAGAAMELAIVHAARDVVFESYEDGQAPPEFSSGGSLAYVGDDADDVTVAVDQVFDSLVKKRKH